MRVQASLREPLVVQRLGSAREQDQKIRTMLDEVGLPHSALERYPHEFSGGQRQRIALARALMLEPKVIVADEPVSALDVSIRSQVLNLMKRLQAEHNMASIVISHDLAVVKYLSDRIGVMYLGKLVELGTGDDIYHRPAHPYTEALIKTIPVPDPAVERTKEDVGIRGELPSSVYPPSGCRFRTRCPRAQERCAEEEPLLRQFGAGHQAACHFPLHPAADENGARGRAEAPLPSRRPNRPPPAGGGWGGGPRPTSLQVLSNGARGTRTADLLGAISRRGRQRRWRKRRAAGASDARMPAPTSALSSGGRPAPGAPNGVPSAASRRTLPLVPHLGVRLGREADWEAEGACGREHPLVIGNEHVEFAFELLRGREVDGVEAAQLVGVDCGGAVEERVIEGELTQRVEHRGSARSGGAAMAADRAHDLDARERARHPDLPRLEEREQRLRLWLANHELDDRRGVEVDGARGRVSGHRRGR